MLSGRQTASGKLWRVVPKRQLCPPATPVVRPRRPPNWRTENYYGLEPADADHAVWPWGGAPITPPESGAKDADAGVSGRTLRVLTTKTENHHTRLDYGCGDNGQHYTAATDGDTTNWFR